LIVLVRIGGGTYSANIFALADVISAATTRVGTTTIGVLSAYAKSREYIQEVGRGGFGTARMEMGFWFRGVGWPMARILHGGGKHRMEVVEWNGNLSSWVALLRMTMRNDGRTCGWRVWLHRLERGARDGDI
jgi:hypothetical protein